MQFVQGKYELHMLVFPIVYDQKRGSGNGGRQVTLSAL